MTLDTWIEAGGLDDSFPVPRGTPFTPRQAIDAGVTPGTVRALVAAGLLRRPVRGVLVDADLPDSPRARAECLRLLVPPDCVVVDRHAGWLLGAEMILAPGEHLGLRPLSLYRPSGHGRLRNDLCSSGERNLVPSDVVEVDGIRVTTPLRTAADLGRVRFPSEAIAGVSMMLRHGGFRHEELLQQVSRFRRMRWVTTLRAIAPLADARFESPPEAVLSLRCVEAGLPLEPQVEVHDGERFVARLDLGDREQRVGVEYDGAEWHSSESQLAHDRERREGACELGWTIRAFGAADLSVRHGDVDRQLGELRRHLEQRSRRPA